MKLWIDCEWNSLGGELISMALVSKEGHEWYEVLNVFNPHPWVATNVMPNLLKQPILKKDMQLSLSQFLKKFDSVCVIADWPEDIAYFCNFLIVSSGVRIDTPPLSFVIDRTVSSEKSAIPHNALADAKAIMEMSA